MPQKLLCEVTELTDHDERVYSILLQPERPAPRFLAGQFLHLALDPYTYGDFWPESRIFSIASMPTDQNLLRITFAVKGKFTARMEAELRVGSLVWVKLPYGEFTINTERDICLLAGGTGITAFTALLAGLAPDHPRHIYVFYGARQPNLLIYRTLLESSAQRCENLWTYFLSEEGEIPGVTTGRLNLEFILQYIPDPFLLDYYLSGPPQMLKGLSNALGDRGIPAKQVIIDAWE